MPSSAERRWRTVPVAMCAATLVALIPWTSCVAQPQASERAMVSQTVDGTTITIEYYRPQARGRSPLFGKVVPWGDIWTPGANWATTIETDKDIQIAGHPLTKGKYSIWMIPQEHEPWTVILFTKAHQFHTHAPDKQFEHLRFTVAPDSEPPVEMLTFSFPEVRADGMVLRMQWGSTAILLPIAVSPSATALTPHERRAWSAATVLLGLSDGKVGEAKPVK